MINHNSLDQLKAVPETIQEQGLFCCWKYEIRNGKETKVPYNPVTGRKAAGREDYISISAAVRVLDDPASRYDGIGIGLYDGMCGIDIDHCVDDDGRLSDLAIDVIRTMDSYTELSPSGHGVHILFMTSPEKLGLARDDFETRFYQKNTGIGMEVYISGITYRYLTMTGNAVHRGPISRGLNRTNECQQILTRYMKRPTRIEHTAHSDHYAASPVPISLSDADLISKAKTNQRTGPEFTLLWDGDWQGRYPSQSEADYALMKMLAFWTGKDPSRMDSLFRHSGLMRAKYANRGSYRSSLIRSAINATRSTYTPSQSRGYELGWDDPIGD